MGRTQHSKTDIVVPVVRVVVVAVGRTPVVLVVDPGAAAQHTTSRLREPRTVYHQHGSIVAYKL